MLVLPLAPGWVQKLQTLTPDQMQMLGVGSGVVLLFVILIGLFIAFKVFRTAMSLMRRVIMVGVASAVLLGIALAVGIGILVIV